MTSDELKKAAEVMLACANGRAIQCKRKDYDEAWENTKSPGFDWILGDYRIKPQPKFVPFTHNDVEMFMGKLLRHKRYTNTFCIIKEANTDYLWLGGGMDSISYKHLLENYTFLDGSICGKIVDE